VHLSGGTLHAMRDAMPSLVNTPDLRIPIDPARKWAVVEAVRARLADAGTDMVTIDGVRVASPDGWWLLRASNTQDMLTIRAEGRDATALARLLAECDAHLAACGVARD
jgi:phosphomannomutase